MKSFFITVLLAGTLGIQQSYAQTEVKFHIDLKAQIKDSVFVVGKDQIQLIGSEYPLDMSAGLRLRDKAPNDSVYTTTVHFPSRQNGKILKYKYRYYHKGKWVVENRIRVLPLEGKDRDLDITYFNGFVQ